MSEDGGAEGHGDGVGGVYDVVRQHKDVAEIREQVGGYDQGKGGVDCPRQVTAGILHLANDVVGVVPSVVCPQPSVEGYCPLAAACRGASEPVRRLPLLTQRVRRVGEPRNSDDDAGDGDGEEPKEFEEHEEIGTPRS